MGNCPNGPHVIGLDELGRIELCCCCPTGDIPPDPGPIQDGCCDLSTLEFASPTGLINLPSNTVGSWSYSPSLIMHGDTLTLDITVTNNGVLPVPYSIDPADYDDSAAWTLISTTPTPPQSGNVNPGSPKVFSASWLYNAGAANSDSSCCVQAPAFEVSASGGQIIPDEQACGSSVYEVLEIYNNPYPVRQAIFASNSLPTVYDGYAELSYTFSKSNSTWNAGETANVTISLKNLTTLTVNASFGLQVFPGLDQVWEYISGTSSFTGVINAGEIEVINCNVKYNPENILNNVEPCCISGPSVQWSMNFSGENFITPDPWVGGPTPLWYGSSQLPPDPPECRSFNFETSGPFGGPCSGSTCIDITYPASMCIGDTVSYTLNGEDYDSLQYSENPRIALATSSNGTGGLFIVTSASQTGGYTIIGDLGRTVELWGLPDGVGVDATLTANTKILECESLPTNFWIVGFWSRDASWSINYA